MTLWLRMPVALLIGLIAGCLGFLATLFLVGHFGSCPPQVRTCDLPMIAGVGLGLVAGPIVGLIATWASFRRLGRVDER